MSKLSTNWKSKRFKCPCCGFYTLDCRGGYDICLMCNWEDDGQDDQNADRILGGPNSDYSLSEARVNFKKYLCMYRPSNDMSGTGGDLPEEKEIKKQLMNVYPKVMDYSNILKSPIAYLKVLWLERKLKLITERKIDEYCRKIEANRKSKE